MRLELLNRQDTKSARVLPKNSAIQIKPRISYGNLKLAQSVCVMLHSAEPRGLDQGVLAGCGLLLLNPGFMPQICVTIHVRRQTQSTHIPWEART